MNDVIQFAQYVYTSKISTTLSHNYNDIMKKLPSSKKILPKLYEYCHTHPEFCLLLRTNLWRTQTNPISTLTNILPIELWNIIDSYESESRLEQLIITCKKYYICNILSQLEKEYKLHFYTMNSVSVITNYLQFYYAKQSTQHCKILQRDIKENVQSYLSC